VYRNRENKFQISEFQRNYWILKEAGIVGGRVSFLLICRQISAPIHEA
jgi:hypothetical protein